MYHFVLPAKYRRSVFTPEVDRNLIICCSEIEKRYEIRFLEIGTDKDHVYFLVQAAPTYSPAKIVTIIKSLTARYIFQENPEVKKQLWGGEFWSDGYFANTVGQYSNENVIAKYIQNQGKPKQKYTQLQKQDPLF